MKTIAFIALWATGGLAAGGSAATETTTALLGVQQPAAATLRPAAAAIDRKCSRALKRLRLEYRSLEGPYGGCACIARQLEASLKIDHYQAALDTFLTAVIARGAKPEELPKIRGRFRQIRDFHALTSASYRMVVGTTTSALKQCG